MSKFVIKHGGYQIIHNIPMDAKPRSAYLILYDKLRSQDDSENWAVDLKKWMGFRKEFIHEQLLEKGELTCSYCGRNDLVEGFHEFEKKDLNNKISNLATIDHIVPLSKGGDKYLKVNCCIACKKCNRKKGNKVLTDFI